MIPVMTEVEEKEGKCGEKKQTIVNMLFALLANRSIGVVTFSFYY